MKKWVSASLCGLLLSGCAYVKRIDPADISAMPRSNKPLVSLEYAAFDLDENGYNTLDGSGDGGLRVYHPDSID